MNKNNNRTIIKFIVILTVSFSIGLFSGKIIKKYKEIIDSVNYGYIASKICAPLAFSFLALTIVMYLSGLLIYLKSKSSYLKLLSLDDDEFEARIDDVERKMNLSGVISTIMFILSFFFLAFVLACDISAKRAGCFVPQISKVIAIVSEVLNLFFISFISSLIVKLEKTINPMKKGNILDIRFRKDWMESMDEGELMKFAKGSRKAYFAGLFTGLVLWGVAFISMFAFNTGIMPIFCITIMLLVMFITSEINSR